MKTIGIIGFILSILALAFVIREAIVMQKFRKSQGYKKGNGTKPTAPLTNENDFETLEEFWASQDGINTH
jgi:hypothetical protein